MAESCALIPNFIPIGDSILTATWKRLRLVGKMEERGLYFTQVASQAGEMVESEDWTHVFRGENDLWLLF